MQSFFTVATRVVAGLLALAAAISALALWRAFVLEFHDPLAAAILIGTMLVSVAPLLLPRSGRGSQRG